MLQEANLYLKIEDNSIFPQKKHDKPLKIAISYLVNFKKSPL